MESNSGRAAYMRQFRKDNPDYVARQKKQQKARERALMDVANLHPTQYAMFLSIRRKELGLPSQT